jgi:hypothetical protein
MTTINQANGIHLYLRASVGLATAGHHWISVPPDGVPADILPRVQKYLGTRESDSRDQMVVDGLTWESVRAEIERDDCLAAERRARVEADDAERARVQAEQHAQIRKYITSSPAHEWPIGTGRIDAHHLTGPQHRIHISDLPEDLRALVYAERDRREAERRQRDAADEERKRAAQAAILAERDAWIAAHGSDRLRKGLAAGMIAKLGAVYREERVAVDFGSDWRSWDAVDDNEDSDRLNPTEAELDALLDARRRWPDAALEAQLRTVRKSAGEYEEEEPAGEWSPALMVRLPWERDRWAIRYL